MHLSDMQEKDIISIKTGENYGRIIDAVISESGTILEFLVEEKKFFKKISQVNEKKFKYSDIKKIGSDVILVDL